MEKLDFRTINDEVTRKTVISKIHHYSGVKLPESYLEQGKTVGVFLHNQLVAG